MKDSLGKTPLHLASEFGLTEVVSALLDAGKTDINETDILGETPLLLACAEEREETALLLLRTPGIDVRARNQNGTTALQYSVNTNSVKREIIKMIVADETPTYLYSGHGGDLVDEVKEVPPGCVYVNHLSDKLIEDRSACEKSLMNTLFENNKRMEMILASLGAKGGSRRTKRSRRGRRHSRKQ